MQNKICVFDFDGVLGNSRDVGYAIYEYQDVFGQVARYNTNQNSWRPFRSDSTETYTFGSSTGGTVDLGARNNYRYVNAQNVYKKRIEDI